MRRLSLPDPMVPSAARRAAEPVRWKKGPPNGTGFHAGSPHAPRALRSAQTTQESMGLSPGSWVVRDGSVGVRPSTEG
jgi:hypothetical protein